MPIFQLVLSALTAALTLLAEDVPFERPLIGFVWDGEAHQIRPLAGTPGAALVTSPLVLSRDVNAAIISNVHKFALVSTTDDVQIVRGLDREIAWVAIDGAVKAFNLGALSYSAKSAVVYSSDCGCVQVLSDLLATPRVARTITLPQDSGEVKSVAVTDDGVVGVGLDRLLIYPAEADARLIPVNASAIAFSADGQTLGYADRSRKSVGLIADFQGSAQVTELASERDGVAEPVAFAFGTAGQLLSADHESGLRIIDTKESRITAIDCACQPSSIERTASEGVFRVTGLEAGAVWILQLGDAEARTLFIPIDRMKTEVATEGLQ